MTRLYIYDNNMPNLTSKLQELRTVSSPKMVIANAIKYFNDPDVKVYLSTQKYKKYMIQNPQTNKWTHFGDIRYQDFTHHRDNDRRTRYINRATNIGGSWKSNKYSPNSLAINLLWA
jgi:hypothetical protein